MIGEYIECTMCDGMGVVPTFNIDRVPKLKNIICTVCGGQKTILDVDGITIERLTLEEVDE